MSRSSLQHPDGVEKHRDSDVAPSDIGVENKTTAEAEKGSAPAPNAWSDPSAFPDGGTKAWLTVTGSAACLFVSFGWINCVGIFQDYYETHQLKDYTTSEISWIPTLQVFFMLFCGPFVGKIYDDFGARLLLIAGAFFHVFGLMMTSISTKYYQIMLSQAVCSAIGASMVFYPAFTCLSTWFFKKRGMAIGLAAAGSSLGGVIFPVMVVQLLPKVGFGWTMRICAFLILGLLILAIGMVTSRVPPRRTPLRLSAFINPLKERTFVLLTAAIFFFYWGMFIPITFLVVEARSHGMSEHLANYLVAILNAASIFGRIVPAAMGDKLGRFNVMIVMAIFTVILILALWIPATGNGALITFAALYGVGSGAGVSLIPALCATISPLQEIGTRTGVAIAIAAFASLTGSPIGGQIVSDERGSFRGTKIFAGLSCAVGVAFFIAARWSAHGLKAGKF